ncbi:hypothetical protein SDC9_187945 [bioreactor metagenome]|uniref:Uncharacterized protein n=1 Tax=bioreactor metagenome TaxID=1076179 RepID=A0A645HMZ3_9ZZZZ
MFIDDIMNIGGAASNAHIIAIVHPPVPAYIAKSLGTVKGKPAMLAKSINTICLLPIASFK